MARILSLEDMRSTGDGALDRLLADGDRGVRRRAALAAGRIGDASMAGALVARMNDTEPEVRQMSAFALGLLGDPRRRSDWWRRSTTRIPIVRARAVEALGRVGGPRAAPAIVEAWFAPRCRRTRRSSPSAATTRAARTIPGSCRGSGCSRSSA